MNDEAHRQSAIRHEHADKLAHTSAAFLNQVLDLDDDPSALASELSIIKRDHNAAIFTIQLESSVGMAAFLVYTYVLDARGGDGHTGKELFDAGLETLQTAAARNAPGPRAVAHAETETHGFILATTPGTYRALTGNTSADTLTATPEELPSGADTSLIRSEAAEEMLKLLQEANDQARVWLHAIRTASGGPSGEEDPDLISFTEAETELALFLLDDSSIGDLLRSLNLLVATAQQHTAEALADDTETETRHTPSRTDAATGSWPTDDR